MKKSLLFVFLLTFAGSPGMSQSVDISTLSDYEKQMHRSGWCYQFWSFELYDEIPDLNMKRISDILDLLQKNGFRNNDKNRVWVRAKDDLRTQFILGEITFTQSDADSCDEDLRKILAKEYIPNFSYMEK